MDTAHSPTRRGIILIVLALLAAMATIPGGANAADHLDAPSLTSPGARGDADINDVFVFEGKNSNRTVLALTTHPAAGVISPDAFPRDVLYQIKVDTDGDAIEDISFKAKFGKVRNNGNQKVQVKVDRGRSAIGQNFRGSTAARGLVEDEMKLRGGGKVWTGLRSDPFFFDLGGFLGTVEGADNGRMFNDGNQNDFFAELNTMAIVIEVPDRVLERGTIGVWATTAVKEGGKWVQTDRMGRPAINTVVNSPGPIVQADANAKNVYNSGVPADDPAAFTQGTIDALVALSQFDTEGSYSDAEAGALAGVLLPDVIVYDTQTAAVGPLNGRTLTDDVIDIELRIVTGGDPLGLFAGRDADGFINGDGVGPHTDLLNRFPYLGAPH